MSSRMLRWTALLLAAVMATVITGCVSVNTTGSGAIGLDRKQRMSIAMSAEDMEKGANAAYAEVLSKARQENSLNSKPQMTQRVRSIAKRIIPTVGVFRKDALSWNWKVNVIESEQLNAWAMPGGKIAFYSGIITKLDLSDGEIAAIMGHEIAHALREHSRERASEQANKNLAFQLIGTAVGAHDSVHQLANVVYNATVGLPNSRLHETESDRIGIELMARAGYDPQAAIQVWRKMAEVGGSGGPEFMSTHPSHESRIKDLTGYAKKVRPLYRQSGLNN